MLDPKKTPGAGHRIEQVTVKRKKTQVVARRVIVKLNAPEGDRALADICDSILSGADGAQVLRSPGETGRMVLLLPEGASVSEWSKRLTDSDLVEYAEPDVVDTAQIVPNDPRYTQQWGPPLVGAEAAWDLQTGAAGVLIGIIDSGISMTGANPDHDDLSTAGRFTLGTDFVDGGTPRDLNGHGTHVAGIAAATGNNSTGVAGMNWGSRVYICRTLDANGNGSSADFADAVEEITDFAVANNLHAVINYSGGGANNTTKMQACQYASDRGMLLCAATGNDNGGPVIWPAAYSTTIVGVIAVGSTEANDTVSGFSNVGPEVTVVAPGGDILSTTPTYAVPGIALNYDRLSGTSMATPMVTGLAALMWSRHTGFSNQKIKECLQNTAVKLGAGNFNNSWGFGRINAHAALTCGDLVFVPTKLGGDVCPVKSVLTSFCPQKSVLLCPSEVRFCPSKLPLLCPLTKLSTCEWEPPTDIFPSAIDGCPSTPGGCDWRIPFEDPGFPVNVRLTRLENRFRQMELERWYRGAPEASSAEGGDTEGWFYIDDNGDVHEV